MLVLSKTIKAIEWLTAAFMVAFSVLFAGAFIASGLYTSKLGLIVCGIGWALITVPIYYRQHPAKKVSRLSLAVGFVGGLIFMLGLAIHSGAL